MPRALLHVDMDAFFASIEQLDDPSLRGRPVLVGGAGRRGVVAAASYEAREFGCRSAQPMAIARRNCPDAVIVPPRGRRYHDVSRQVFTILQRFTPRIEPLSIDEAFLDVTGTERLQGPATAVAARIKQEVRDELGLTASVGVAPNKFLAKLASDLDKPDGLTIIDERWVRDRLPEQPLARMWGVGPATEASLAQMGLQTFGDIQRLPPGRLEGRVGQIALRLRELAFGRDDRAVVTGRGSRSISHEQTFGEDLADPAAVIAVLRRQAEQVAHRVRAESLKLRSVTVKIRFGDFETVTRSRTVAGGTDRTDVVQEAAQELFEAWVAEGYRPVRLIGVAAGHLSASDEQLQLFTAAADERSRRLDRVADQIQDRLGAGAIHRGARSRPRPGAGDG